MRILGVLLLAAVVGCGDDAAPGSHNDAGDDPAAGRGGRGGAADSGGRGGSESSAGHTGGSSGHTAGSSGSDAKKRELPRVYPLVRASTPTGLIADIMLQTQAFAISPDAGVGVLPQGLGGEVNLAVAVQERFYSMGPTALLRIVKDLDDRLAGLDTDPAKHECLTATPTERTYTFPGGPSFGVKLQCLQRFGTAGSSGAGWVAFGFGAPFAGTDDDAGVSEADGGTANDAEAFYLVEGQAGGMGGAYRVQGNDVEAWIVVADSNVPTNSQVIMHLVTHKSPATSELALAGSGVGFCSAHLKTSSDHLYVAGKTNAPPPPGTPMMAGVQYCDSARAGCFAISDLNTDLGGAAAGCQAISASSFEVHGSLDASSDPGANVMPGQLYTLFNQQPTNVADF